MRTTVVCGLLGSGKTTFIRNFVKGVTGKAVVLVNDFGAAGIDGEIFSAGGIEAVELPSGCVCCTLKADLITTVQRIVREFAPQHLLIEPSGVASPSGVLEALASAGVNTVSVAGIVDATEFTELYGSGMYGSFFEDQIKNSDVILVNKTDLAGEEKTAETRRMIESLNPRAVIFRTKNAVIDASLPNLASEGRKIPFKGPHFHFDTASFRLEGRTGLASLIKLFEDLTMKKHGNVVRAKALVSTDQGPYRFDISFGKVDHQRFEKDIADSRIVIVGERLDHESIRIAINRSRTS